MGAYGVYAASAGVESGDLIGAAWYLSIHVGMDH